MMDEKEIEKTDAVEALKMEMDALKQCHDQENSELLYAQVCKDCRVCKLRQEVAIYKIIVATLFVVASAAVYAVFKF